VKIPDLTKAAKALKMPIDHLEQPCAFFGVYDGHQGHLCSEFVAKNFHMQLLKKLTAEKNAAAWTEQRMSKVLQEVCQELDNEFLAKFRTAPDGSTVVVAFVTGTRLFVAWVGDSRCVLCQSTSKAEMSTIALTEDHRPSMESEAARVKKAGGVVVDLGGALRVAHQGYEEKVREIRRAAAQGLGVIAKEPVALAVSRSLGDRHFKAVTGSDLLVATPSVRCIRLDKSHKFLALMCDGIPDVMSNEDAVFELDYVREPSTPQNEVKAACGYLVQEAYKRGSEDNLTALLARLQWADVDAKEAAKAQAAAKEAAAKASVPAKDGSAKEATAKKSATTPPLPGESVLDALKRNHRAAMAERSDCEGPDQKKVKVAEDLFQAAEGAL
jgi:protein phosphatase 2C family protein 2/3/protein phosphatase 1G